MFTPRARYALLLTALVGSLSACSSDPAATARDLCHERVAAESIHPEGAEFVETEELDPVDSTHFFYGVVEFPIMGEMVQHTYRCKVNPEIDGILFNETVVERMTN